MISRHDRDDSRYEMHQEKKDIIDG